MIFDSFDDGKPKPKKKETISDLVQDYQYIWASFKQEFRCDLNTKPLTWWEFNHMLDGMMLKGDNAYSKVLEYRSYTKPTKNAKRAEKMEYEQRRELQLIYRLKRSSQEIKQSIENKIDSFVGMFRG